jgi:hypothetical protein
MARKSDLTKETHQSLHGQIVGFRRKNKLPNKACAVYALQLPAPAKRNKAVKLRYFRGAGNLLLIIAVLSSCDPKLERKLSADSVQRDHWHGL